VKSVYPSAETRWNGIVTDGAPSMAGRNSGVSSLICDNVKNTTDRDMVMCYCLILQECLCLISPKMSQSLKCLMYILLKRYDIQFLPHGLRFAQDFEVFKFILLQKRLFTTDLNHNLIS
jgi:hypothetical protein